MKLSEQRLEELLKIYFNQEISPSEREELWGYVNDLTYAEQIQANIPDAVGHPVNGVTLSPGSEQRILQYIFNYNKASISRTKTIRLWPKLAIAAAAATIVFGVWYFNYKTDVALLPHNDIARNDIAPGKNSATLTLANGKKIRLGNVAKGEIAKEAGVSISKSADGTLVYQITGNTANAKETNILSTDKGETYEVRLPDGSLVDLNARSSLEYPANFSILKQRRVKLTGEGYFQVAKDKAHPFIVQTDKQEVEVLGTHFNINSYSDEHAITTTLVEGSVKVRSGDNLKVIHPGEQVQNASGHLSVAKVNLDNIIDWKDGDFNLTGMEFPAAMRKIARWYNVEIIYDSSLPPNIQADGWISRKQTLNSVLDMIQKLGIVHFRVEGRKVYVLHKN